jgi:CubicO group peptidase (beta-lactamase class C family)
VTLRRRQFLLRLGLGTAGLGIASSISVRALAADGTKRQPMPRGAPETQGVSSLGVMAFLNAIARAGHELHSLMVASHGRIAVEGWWEPYRPESVHMLYSLTKSFTSTAVGFAVAEGRLQIDDPVTKFFPEELPRSVSSNLAALRVSHLLTMSSGHSTETNATSTESTDWAKAFLAQPIANPPGSQFLYDSGNSYMLAAIVQKLSGEKLVDYLKPRLFDPLGIDTLTWETDPRGLNIGGWGLSVTTETLVKFGQFYLQGGEWNGRQLLPREWVEQATKFRIQQPAAPGADLDQLKKTSDWHQGYGYQFWRCRHYAFRGDGAFGQFCIVLPDRNAVVAITSSLNDMQGVMNLVWNHLLPAIQNERMPPDSSSASKLKRMLGSLALSVPNGAASSATARNLAGKRFELEPNAMGAKRFSFDFSGGICVFRMETEKGASEVRCGLGKWVDGVTDMPGSPPRTRELASPVADRPLQLKVAGASAWPSEQTLEMHWRFYETPHHDKVVCRFDGDSVQIEFANSITMLNAASHPETRPVLKGRVRA